jgi:hypothetical protein
MVGAPKKLEGIPADYSTCATPVAVLTIQLESVHCRPRSLLEND